MKHKMFACILILFSLLVITGCDQNELMGSYVLSSDKVVYGDILTEHFKTNEVTSSMLKLETWHLIDIDDLK